MSMISGNFIVISLTGGVMRDSNTTWSKARILDPSSLLTEGLMETGADIAIVNKYKDLTPFKAQCQIDLRQGKKTTLALSGLSEVQELADSEKAIIQNAIKQVCEGKKNIRPSANITTAQA